MLEKNTVSKICVYPFYHVEIDFNGDVYCCCPEFTNFYTLGNIFEQS
ncbi:MAG: SPASM domain-containing protein, partial [Candidatus Gastranaerophilaceae bacterium]